MNGTTVFFDLETGGVESHHPNIQIAAVAVKGWKEVEAFERKIRFEPSKCDPEALMLNGFREADWREQAVPERDAMVAFDEFCWRHGDMRLVSGKTGRPYTMARLAGHNVAAFDVPRLRAAMERAGVGFMRGCWWYPLDTLQRALWHFTERGLQPPENYKLQTLAQHLGIPAQGAAHEALADVRLSVLVAKSILTADVPV